MSNSETTKEVISALGLSPAAQNMPAIIPVVEVNPKLMGNNKVLEGTLTNGTTVTFYTIPVGYNFYINSVSLSMSKDAANTATRINVQVSVGGQAVRLIPMALVASTAEVREWLQTFRPIKLDSGTIITIESDNGTAAIKARAVVIGRLEKVE